MSALAPDTAVQPPRVDWPPFAFDNSYARELEGLYIPWLPSPAPQPRLVQLNRTLAEELGLDAEALASPAGVQVLAGNALPAQATPIAQAYAGHQFGGFSPQLGDGRALLLGELIDARGRRRDIAFKGSGRTPFSRGGDGKAVLGPVLREFILGEAMHALGIPTTRALAAVATGETVWRDHGQPGAVLTRVAASHVRVGTFQFLAARGDEAGLRRLADYVIARHDPGLVGREDRVLRLLDAVVTRQAELVAAWMAVGFIHGVMNTDNMTLSGETIDYGPCAFLEAYDPEAVFSSIDLSGRYAFGRQARMANWNLVRLAETLLPLVDPDRDTAIDRVNEVLAQFTPRHEARQLTLMRAKLGLLPAAIDTVPERDKEDADLVERLLALLRAHRIDYTLGLRHLGAAAAGDTAPWLALFASGSTSSAAPGPGDGARTAAAAWLADWQARAARDGRSPAERAAAMNAVNPRIIARNHKVEEALESAMERDDLRPFEALLAAVRRPYDADPALAPYAEPAAPEVTACYRTFCGT